MKQIIQRLAAIEQYTLLAAKRVLNIEEAAIITGLSVDTLRRKVGARELPAYRPNGKHLFFNKEELEEWMMRGKIESKYDVLQRMTLRVYSKGKKVVKA